MDADEPVEEGSGDDFTWEDPRERPRDGATLIRERSGRLELETFVPLVAQHTGLHRSEAAKVCQAGHGILVDNIETAVAQALAADLNAHDEKCFIIPAAAVIALPRAKPIHGLRLLKAELHLVDAAGHVEVVPWDKLLILAAAHVPVEKTTSTGTGGNLFTRHVSYGAAAPTGNIKCARRLAPTARPAASTRETSFAFLEGQVALMVRPAARPEVWAGRCRACGASPATAWLGLRPD